MNANIKNNANKMTKINVMQFAYQFLKLNHVSLLHYFKNDHAHIDSSSPRLPQKWLKT